MRERVGLPITVGVARTKHLAKVASAVAKPDGLLVVPPRGELGFLHPLPVERLWGVGPVTSGKLRARGIETVGQVAWLEEDELVRLLGRAAGRHLFALAHNRDPRRVRVGRRRGSIGSQSAGRRSPRELDPVLIGLVDRVTRRMRKAGRSGRTVVLRLRFADFTRATRSVTLPYATFHTETVLATARGLLAAALPLIEERGCTLLGLAVANLDDSPAADAPARAREQIGAGRGRRRGSRAVRHRLADARSPPRAEAGVHGAASARLRTRVPVALKLA